MDSTAKTYYVVLGATGGIGSELCRRLAGRGSNPVLAARAENRLKVLGDELGAPYHALDATNGAADDNLFSCLKEEHGPNAGAVSCVGAFLLKPAHLTSDDERWVTGQTIGVDGGLSTLRPHVRRQAKA